MNPAKYHIGNFKQDSNDSNLPGWFVGNFMEGPRHSDDVEVKYWEFPTGDTDHITKVLNVYEVTIILTGKVSGIIDGQTVTMEAGQYMAIPAGIESNLPTTVIEAATGLTIKAPSRIDNKTPVQ